MNRLWTRSAVVALAGGWLLSTHGAFALCPGGVVAFGPPANPVGFKNCPLGNATLTETGLGTVVVSNISGSGNDGVEIAFMVGPADVQEASLEIDEPAGWAGVTAGAFLNFRAAGIVNGAPKSEISTVQLLVESFLTYTMKITPDYSALGTSTYHVAVTTNGVPVAIAYDVQGPVRVKVAGAVPRADTPPVLRRVGTKRTGMSMGLRGLTPADVSQALEWAAPIEVLLPGGSPAVVGDKIIFSAGTEEILVNSISTVSMTAKDTGDITITNETAPILRPIPTISQWGMIGMALALVVGGAIMIRRRGIAAAPA